MRIEEGAGPAGSGTACGGFRIVFDEGAPQVRLLPGQRRLAQGLTEAVLRGLSQAPQMLCDALQVDAPPRPYEEVEVSLVAGERAQGEALPLGPGSIRLCLGEATLPEDAERLARHEALHLLLAKSLGAGERWNDPEIAFADWIVRGIESGCDAALPRFHAPLPRLFEKVPATRSEVQKQLQSVGAAPAAARRYFGEPLFAELTRVQGADPAVVEQRQLWIVEAALGTHYLEAAGRLHVEDEVGLRAVVLDDWLMDYEQYARAVANPPSGAGNLWRLSEAGWSRDPLVRLSVAAQALQRDDHCHFAGERPNRADEPVVWKNRGRVRLPLFASSPRTKALPIHGFRSVLREIDAPQALALVEQAARGAEELEARALWPRILARLLAAELAAPEAEPEAVPIVQIVDGGEGADETFAHWSQAAATLRAMLGERSAWVPKVAEPLHASTLAEFPRAPAAILLVHPQSLGARTLIAARALAARLPLRGALFRDHLAEGEPYERAPDFDPPLDPRYREEIWIASPPPATLSDLPAHADAATSEGRLTTAVSHLLAAMAVGLLECHYPRPRAPARSAARG